MPSPPPAPRSMRSPRTASPLRRLNGREYPGVVADWTCERSEVLDLLHGRARALHHGSGGVIDRVVEHGGGNEDGHIILPRLLPGLGHLGAVDVESLCSIRLARAP